MGYKNLINNYLMNTYKKIIHLLYIVKVVSMFMFYEHFVHLNLETVLLSDHVSFWKVSMREIVFPGFCEFFASSFAVLSEEPFKKCLWS